MPKLSSINDDPQPSKARGLLDSSSKFEAWTNYVSQHTKIMDFRIKARQFRATSKQNRLSHKIKATEISNIIPPPTEYNATDPILLFREGLFDLLRATEEANSADTELDFFEENLIHEEYALQTGAPAAIDSSPAMFQILQDHGFDFLPKASGYAPSSAPPSTREDIAPEDRSLREKLARINSLEARILQLKTEQHSSLDLTISTSDFTFSPEKQAEFDTLMQELEHRRAEFDQLRPTLRTRTDSRVQGPTFDEQSLLPTQNEAPALSNPSSTSDAPELISLDDLLNKPMEPFPDIDFDEHYYENPERKHFVHSWLFDKSLENPTHNETDVVSSYSAPLPKPLDFHGLESVAATGVGSRKLDQNNLRDVQSLPLGGNSEEKILLTQLSPDSDPP